MKNIIKNEKGSSLIIIILFLVVVSAVGFTGWLVMSKKDSGSQSNKTGSTESQTVQPNADEVLASVQEEIEALPHRTDTAAEKWKADKRWYITHRENSPAMDVEYGPDFTVVFNASGYYPDGGTEVGTAGETKHDSATRALKLDKVDSILTSKGLTKTETITNYTGNPTHLYSGSGIYCNVSDSKGLGLVMCALGSRQQSALDGAKASRDIVIKDHKDVADSERIGVVYLEKDNVKAVYASPSTSVESTGGDRYILVNTGSSWTYLGSQYIGQSGKSTNIGCSVLGKAEYKNIFKCD